MEKCHDEAIMERKVIVQRSRVMEQEVAGGRDVLRQIDGSIRDRHLSPALRALPGESLKTVRLTRTETQVYNRLWRPIADGRMRAGARFNEADLEKVLGASRTTIRAVLEHMAAEGLIDLAPRHTASAHKPSLKEAHQVFDVLGGVMSYIVRELASPDRILSETERRLIDLHLDAQGQAARDGEPIAAHLLGTEFLILLAAIHGVPLLTELIAHMAVLATLALKAYGHFPPPAWYIAFQKALTEAILEHRQDDALAELSQRLAHVRRSLRTDDCTLYEEGDLGVLLGSP
jgi:DNA-binding GntR family transcriptional regulator